MSSGFIKYVLRPNQRVVFSIIIPKGWKDWETAETELRFNEVLNKSPVIKKLGRTGAPFVHTATEIRIPEIEQSIAKMDWIAQLSCKLDDGTDIQRRLDRAIICKEIDVYLEYLVTSLLNQIRFQAVRLGGPNKPDIVAALASHPNFIFDIEVTTEDRYDLPKYGYDVSKYNVYKDSRYKVNHLLIIYTSQAFDPRIKRATSSGDAETTIMSLPQFYSLIKDVRSKRIDLDSALAKMIRPGIADIEPDTNMGEFLTHALSIRVKVDPTWGPTFTSQTIQPLPYMDWQSLGNMLQIAKMRTVSDIYAMENMSTTLISDGLKLLQSIGAIRENMITPYGSELAGIFEADRRQFLGRLMWLVYSLLGGEKVVVCLNRVQNQYLNKKIAMTPSKISSAIAQSLVDEGYCRSISDASRCTSSMLNWLRAGNIIGEWNSSRGYITINQELLDQIRRHKGYRTLTNDDIKYSRGEL